MKQETFPGMTPNVHGQGGDRDALDRYYTPPDLAAELLDLLPWSETGPTVVLEPSVGGGSFARHLKNRGYASRLIGVDLDPDAVGFRWCDPPGVLGDFEELDLSDRGAQWVVGNPPYANAQKHVEQALKAAPRVAFLLRLAFLESLERVPFWKEFPCRSIWVLSKRPSFTGGSTDSCAYGWFFWDRSDYWTKVHARTPTSLRHHFPGGSP